MTPDNRISIGISFGIHIYRLYDGTIYDRGLNLFTVVVMWLLWGINGSLVGGYMTVRQFRRLEMGLIWGIGNLWTIIYCHYKTAWRMKSFFMHCHVKYTKGSIENRQTQESQRPIGDGSLHIADMISDYDKTHLTLSLRFSTYKMNRILR